MRSEEFSDCEGDSWGLPAYKCDAFALSKGGANAPSLDSPPDATRQKNKVRRKNSAERKSRSLPSIRVSESEYNEIKQAAKNANKKITPFVHDAILVHIKKSGKIYGDYRQRIYVPDYGLIVAVKKVGSLLNQIARRINFALIEGRPIELVKILAELVVVRILLSETIPFSLEKAKEDGGSDNVG